MLQIRLLFICFVLFLFGNDLFAQEIHISEPTVLVPSSLMPSNMKVGKANNNCDIVCHNDKYYVAFRTGPHHFPNKQAKICIMSSRDMMYWEKEYEIALGTDVREPRFLSFNGALFLYFFEGSKSPFRFDPKHIWMAEKKADGWQKEIVEGMDGYVPWRIKRYDNDVLLSAYWGRGLYKNHQGELRLYRSPDGRKWTAISEQAQVSVSGAEEGEFEFDQEGNLWACVRLEGEGALICYAEKNNLHEWKTFVSKKKYDSSCMFRHGQQIYLLARRNVDGNIDKLPKWLPDDIVRTYNLTRYSFTPKTTALYKLNTETKDFDWVMDIPGCGDNAFPAIVSAGENKYYILNYSNDFDNPDRIWFTGQLGKTFIYYITLSFLE